MKQKIVWLAVSFLMVAALLLASCAPTPTPTPTPTPAPTPTPTPTPTGPEMIAVKLTKTDGTVVEKLVEKPQYGGVLVALMEPQTTGFDEGAGALGPNCYGVNLTNEELLEGDWARGPSGTDENAWCHTGIPPLDHWKGCLAENWELTDPNTLVFHICKGVHFALDPTSEASRLVGGREMDANDVVFSLKRNFEGAKGYLASQYPPGFRPVSITASDKWTVEVKCPEGQAGALLGAIAEQTRIVAHEVIGKYGDMQDWRNVVGTGPFMLTDYVAQSSFTYKKNPNYWGKDPLLPQNQLPYLDDIKMPIIPDVSTQLAALRTGRIDQLKEVRWEDRDSLRKTAPELLESVRLRANPFHIFMRVDKPELPFQDIRVRRALAMAIDRQAIVTDFFNGRAEIHATPFIPIAEFMDMYTPIEKMPPETRELYEYHPDKAKQLLAEAGYPKGFKTEIVCLPEYVDMLSIVKAYWAAIGVDLKLDVKEPAVFGSMWGAKTYTQMIMRHRNGALPFDLWDARTGSAFNGSMVSDPRVDEAYEVLRVNFFNDNIRRPLCKEISLYILSQNWYIQFPNDYFYSMWNPWLKGYNGETEVGRLNRYVWPKYVWLDQELKEEMIGRR